MYQVPHVLRNFHTKAIQVVGKLYEVSFISEESDSFYHESNPNKSVYLPPVEVPILITEMSPKYIEEKIGWVLEEYNNQPVPIGIAPIYYNNQFLPWRENVKINVYESTPSTDKEVSYRMYKVSKVWQTSKAITVFLQLVPFYESEDFQTDFETVEDTTIDPFYL